MAPRARRRGLDRRGDELLTISSPVFSTSSGNQLLLAAIATDYLGGANTTVTSVTGAGLTWVRRPDERAGRTSGVARLRSSTLVNAQVSVTLSQVVTTTVEILSFSNVDTSGTNGSGAIGAIASANSISGAPSAALTTTRDNSWVVGVGNDYDNATARTAGANQTIVHQSLPAIGDAYWIQRTLNPVPLSGTRRDDQRHGTERGSLQLVHLRNPRVEHPDTTAPTVVDDAPAADRPRPA
jgi:hypothetical protein